MDCSLQVGAAWLAHELLWGRIENKSQLVNYTCVCSTQRVLYKLYISYHHKFIGGHSEQLANITSQGARDAEWARELPGAVADWPLKVDSSIGSIGSTWLCRMGWSFGGVYSFHASQSLACGKSLKILKVSLSFDLDTLKAISSGCAPRTLFWSKKNCFLVPSRFQMLIYWNATTVVLAYGSMSSPLK